MSISLNILVSGGGIAGGVFASCMLRAMPTAQIKIVERAPQLRLTGASVDIRNSAVDIIKWMGVEPTIREHATKEAGVSFVDCSGRPIATFGATGRTDIQSMTSEYEIFRGTLAKIFIEPIADQVKLVFDDHVMQYDQNDEGVNVTFASGKKETYDLVVGADGLGSKIRGMVIGQNSREQVQDEGVYAAYFTMKKDLLEGSRIAKWRNLTGGRCVFLRPDPTGQTRAMFMTAVTKSDTLRRSQFQQALADGTEAFKQLMEDTFQDGDWLTPEVLQGMRDSDDFYCSPFAQVRCPKLSDERVVLMGDAGYATPAIGTSLAIIGGYMLAGELLKHSGNVPTAVVNYEKQMRAFVKTQQKDDNAMQWLNPQTNWGIRVRDTIIWAVTKTRLDQLAMLASFKLGFFDSPFPLPEYSWPAQNTS